ncbi:MAG TPA: hypothetical protein PKW95_09620 [bacterium]|nr:hypothetical protein [bacterium]
MQSTAADPVSRAADPAPPKVLYLVIALISCASICYQVAITRILSVVMWYHFVFLSVSLAMLGIGAPGVWYALRPPRERSLARALTATALFVPLSVILIFKLGGLLSRGTGRIQGMGSLFPPGVLLIVVAVLAAMLSLGAVVCLLLLQARGKSIGTMYGADLLGATCGALMIIPLMHRLPTPHIIALAGLLPVLVLFILKQYRPLAAVLGAALVLCLLWGEPFTLRYNKDYQEKELLYEKWTPTARLTVIPNIGFTGWGLGTKYDGPPVVQPWIEQDGAAGTAIVPLGERGDDLGYLFYDVTSAGYQLRPPREVCVIGAGGGRDIVTALQSGARGVDAVELNEHTIAALRGPFREVSGGVYDLPGVRAVADEGRSFLTRTPHRYDLIQISLIDSYTATAAGAYALSENYLYTHEALTLYWQRLTPTGLISISRWFEGRRQLEGTRIALMAQRMLTQQGVAEPNRHLAVVSAGKIATVLVSRTPLTDDELARLQSVADARGFFVHWPAPAGGPAPSLFAAFLVNGVPDNLGIDLTSPVDDHPFFFQTISFFDPVDKSVAAFNSTNEHSIVLLKWLLLIVIALALLLFFAPFFFARRLKHGEQFWRGSVYFAAIGVAFMLVETGAIQRFILYLGHPSYAMTVVIAALLFGAGCGSLLAGRVALARVQAWSLLLPFGLLALNVALRPVTDLTLGWAYAWRVTLAVTFLAPSGFLMGFAFPAGMLRFGDPDKAWFWAVNGAMGVLASICSLVLAMIIGFQNTVLAGVAVYIVAALLIKARPTVGEAIGE